jgi:hypothetical protein
MTVKEPVELLYLSLMLRWEETAPPLGKQGLLDGLPEQNSQIARMLFLLRKIAAGSIDKTCRKLELNSRRTRDRESYISKHYSWMEQPKEICDGWHIEACTSLEQKLGILKGLRKLGLSSHFISCAETFVSGKSVRSYLPSLEEQYRIVANIEESHPW